MSPRTAIGLDLGTSGVRAADVSLSKHPPSIEGFGQISLSAGAVNDGEVSDPESVAEALRELWKRARFRGRSVNVGVANQQVVVRAVDLPYMEEEELRSAIQFQVQDYIPFPIEDALLDFQVLDDFMTDGGERMMRVLLVAAQRQMIDAVVDTVQRAGLRLVGIDVTALSLVRSLGQPAAAFGETALEGEAIIDIGSGITNVVVHEGGIPRFVRILTTGGLSLTQALESSLGVSFEDAEGMKQMMGLSEMPGAIPTEEAPRILEQQALAFIDEIRSTLDYYRSQTDAARVSRVIISGGGARLGNLPGRMASSLGLPVELGRLYERVRPGKLGLNEEQLTDSEPLMGAAVGLALGMGEE